MTVGRLMFHEPMLACVRLGAKAGLATAKIIYETTGLPVKVQLATSNAAVTLSRDATYSFETAPMCVLLAASMPKPKSAQLWS